MADDNKPLIYFVDDEPELLQLFEMAVISEFRVATFDDPTSFLEQYIDHKLEDPHILVTDLMMPKMTGLDLIVELREKSEFSSPTILLSGHLAKEHLIVAVNNGVEKILEKPCDLEQIRMGIREVLYRTEIRLIRADVRSTARKIVELSNAIEQFADTELPSLAQLLDRSFLPDDFDPQSEPENTTFREELQRLQNQLSSLIEQERILERLQKVS